VSINCQVFIFQGFNTIYRSSRYKQKRQIDRKRSLAEKEEKERQRQNSVSKNKIKNPIHLLPSLSKSKT
jgi:hypothetical protein